MGFFKDMSLIGKVNKHLNAMEVIIDRGNRGSLRQDDVCLIRSHLNELIEISRKGNRTIDYADFEFVGRKFRLDEIIYIIDDVLKMHHY